jgi:hypothetical protein
MQFDAEERTLLERCAGKPMAQEAFVNADELPEQAVEIVLAALDSLMRECEENTNMKYKDEYVIEEIKKKIATHGASREIEEELDAWMERHSVNGAHRLAWARSVCVPTNRKGAITEEVREAARMVAADKMAEENPLAAAMWETIYGPGLEDHETFSAGCILSGALDYMCDKNVDYVTSGGGTSLWRIFSDAEIVRCATLMACSWDEDACAREEDADEVEGYCVSLARWLKETLGSRFDELRVTEEELGRSDVMALRDDLERWSTECVCV